MGAVLLLGRLVDGVVEREVEVWDGASEALSISNGIFDSVDDGPRRGGKDYDANQKARDEEEEPGKASSNHCSTN